MGLYDFFYQGNPNKKKDENAPEKRRIIIFFEIYFQKFWKLCQLNMLFLLFSLPIVTIGPALAARTYILRNFITHTPVFLWTDFKNTFLRNFKQSFLAGVLQLLTMFILCVNLYFLLVNQSGSFGVIMLVVTAVLLLLFIAVNYYVYLMIVTFDLSFKDIYKNSIILLVANLISNGVAGFFSLLFYIIAGFFLYFGVTGYPFFLIGLTVYGLLIVFALTGFIEQFCIYPKVDALMIHPKTESSGS